jgi:hypothetical protein
LIREASGGIEDEMEVMSVGPSLPGRPHPSAGRAQRRWSYFFFFAFLALGAAFFAVFFFAVFFFTAITKPPERPPGGNG